MNKKLSFSILFLATLFCPGCDWAGRKGKEALNKGGELAGTAATEVIEGVTTGVERTWKVDVQLSPELVQRGLILGRTQVLADETTGQDNRLVIYLSTEKGMSDTLSAIAFDKDGLEMGRTRLALSAPPHSGEHYELRFQDRTELGRKSKVVIQ